MGGLSIVLLLPPSSFSNAISRVYNAIEPSLQASIKNIKNKRFMQALRSITTRRLPTVSRIIKLTTPTSTFHTCKPAMSLFPRTFQEFHPIFRLIDDYDQASRTMARDSFSQLRSFQPKFDVKELKDSYELHGELPGIEQKNVSIEWTDGNTLTISGRTEHRSVRGTPPQGQIEEAQDEAPKEGQHDYHKPTVEDEGDSSKAVTTTEKSGEVAKPAEEQAKYWVSERSVGEFHRSFSFPTRVDHDAVKASMKNGVLSIIVPKAKAQQPRKVNIE